MSLDHSDVARIAHLARLEVSDAEISEFASSLNSILSLVDAMQATDTQGVEPLAHPLDSVQRLRADEVSEVNQREALQTCAPAVEDGLFLVPRVIE
ncbi:Asp-tRNA(Asn)/Glu-tRNA(Gln) amidotransferase subunit GatC [Nitrincola tapanii]|uniref:Aspartyl/glutamyl-tRNA(Asn/Gln) amidotransferase subunit C n=1 Tax=Nitrincola tapanii TaxID=1708751 RepID=A0A5A9W0M6_9GAMM|nr:Asp-tRNA(Asn)/Glu-tRNA(Gln) amidotransferase subunit GatC [Nitrincola tapanii]KAA0874044.1 Asp-tRNA(Asn)/Glu-tRNA(Gln) amidotransferase subunit GatC [Nitrincola tapanii]